MKRCYLFLLLFSLSVCLVVKAPEHYVVSHVMANSGISIMCSKGVSFFRSWRRVFGRAGPDEHE